MQIQIFRANLCTFEGRRVSSVVWALTGPDFLEYSGNAVGQ